MPTFDLYSTATMLALIPSLRRSINTWFLDSFFPLANFSDGEEVIFDVEDDDLEIAPFVHPLAAAKIGEDVGYHTDRLKPAYVKPFHDIKPNEPLRRLAGEPIAGVLSAEAREQIILGQKLLRQYRMILRRKLVMATEVYRTGKVVVVGDDYPAVTVDFQRHADLTVTLADALRWGEAGVSSYDNVQSWIDTLGTISGAAVDKVTMTADAWALFEADPKMEKRLDTTLGQTSRIELGFQPGEAGAPVYKGRIGLVEFYVYNDTYTEGGVQKTLFPAHTVTMAATLAALGTQGHGAILDAEAGYRPLEVFPSSWIERNPSRRVLLSQSAPIPYFGRVNATFSAKVR